MADGGVIHNGTYLVVGSVGLVGLALALNKYRCERLNNNDVKRGRYAADRPLINARQMNAKLLLTNLDKGIHRTIVLREPIHCTVDRNVVPDDCKLCHGLSIPYHKSSSNVSIHSNWTILR